MKVLLLGDVVGRPGRRLVREIVPGLRRELGLDFVVANGENAAGGVGITPRTFEDLVESGVDVVTTGNHVYRHRSVLPLLGSAEDRILRPANHSPAAPGRGFTVRPDAAGRRVAVVNLQGRVFMNPPAEDPFAAADEILRRLAGEAEAVLVDFHAEATSEKQAIGWYLDGRVAAVAGTHTHVPTADARVLPGGTAYVTDVGMTGPHDSCLGVRKEIILEKFRTGLPVRFEVASENLLLQGLFVTVDEGRGLATSAGRLERTLP